MKQNVNLLLITARSDVGGGPRHVRDLIDNLPNQFNVAIASPTTEPYYSLFKKKFHLYIPHRSFSILSFLKILHFCRNNAVDIVHSHGRGASVYGFFLAIWGIKVIHTFHGVHLPKSFKDRMKNILDKMLIGQFVSVIYVSESEKMQAKQLGLALHSEALIVPNGLDVYELKNKYLRIDRNEAREKFHLPLETIILGTLSRLDLHKNNHTLIVWMSHIPENFVLAIAGDGEERNNLMKIIDKLNLSKRVFLVGSVSDPISFLKAIDIYVSHSKGEGLPYAVLEAKAVELPLLLSRVSGHVDLVPDSNLFSSLNEFTNKLSTIKSHPLAYIFDVKYMAREIEKIYQLHINK